MPKYEGLEEYVFDTFNRMFDVFEEDRKRIDASRLCVVRYEDLVAAPVAQMERIYDELELGEFDRVKPALEKRVGALADYRVNRHELPTELRDQIVERWAAYFEKYGYPTEQARLCRKAHPRVAIANPGERGLRSRLRDGFVVF